MKLEKHSWVENFLWLQNHFLENWFARQTFFEKSFEKKTFIGPKFIMIAKSFSGK